VVAGFLRVEKALRPRRGKTMIDAMPSRGEVRLAGGSRLPDEQLRGGRDRAPTRPVEPP